MPPKIFLSHGTSDGKIARVLADTIKRISLDQIEFWFSSDPSPSGGSKPGVWIEALKSQLVASQITLVLLTPNSINRPWLYFESGYGYSNPQGHVIPLCLGMETDDAPGPLAIFQCYEVNSFESLTHFCKKLFGLLDIRFDEEMSRSILHQAFNELISTSNTTTTESAKSEIDANKFQNQVEIYEEIIRATWEDFPIPIHKIDEMGVICGVNKKWLEVFGYTLDEVIDKPADFLMTTESAELAMLVVIPAFWEQGFCQSVRYQYKKKNGDIVDVILNCVETINKDGRKTSFSFVQPVDNTPSLHQLRKDLNSRYRARLSQSSMGFYETNLFGKFTRVNQYVCQLLGLGKKDLLGKNFRTVLDPEFAKNIYRACRRAYSNPIQKSVDLWQIRRRNGEMVKVKFTVSVMTLPNGKPDGFRGTIQVIDEQGKPVIINSRQTA